MSLVLPNIIIHRTIRSLLDIVKADYRSKQVVVANRQKSLLYILFKNEAFSHFDFYTEAVALFNRDGEHARYLDVRLSFDMERASLPTIHVTLNRDNEFSQGIGGNLNAFGSVDFTDDTHSDTNARMYDASLTVVITSDNSFECTLIYELLRSMLILMTPCLDEQGLSMIKIGGSDITLNQQLVPPGIYIRTMDLSCKYSVLVPQLSVIDNAAFDIIRNWRANTTIDPNIQHYK